MSAVDPGAGAPLALRAPDPSAALPVADVGDRRYGVLIGGLRLLLAGDGAVRVLESPPVYRMPNTRAWFLGLANVRGTLVPVYDVAAWLGLPIPEARRMLLVIGQGEASAGVLVDASPRHLLITADVPRPRDSGVAGELAVHTGEAFSIAGSTWTALDWDALFDRLQVLALAAG